MKLSEVQTLIVPFLFPLEPSQKKQKHDFILWRAALSWFLCPQNIFFATIIIPETREMKNSSIRIYEMPGFWLPKINQAELTWQNVRKGESKKQGFAETYLGSFILFDALHDNVISYNKFAAFWKLLLDFSQIAPNITEQ